MLLLFLFFFFSSSSSSSSIDYNPGWVLVCSIILFHSCLFSTFALLPIIFILFRSSSTWSIHLNLVLPAGHVNSEIGDLTSASTHSFSTVTVHQIPHKFRAIFPPHKKQTFLSLWLGLLASNDISNFFLQEVGKCLSTALVI